MFEGKDLIKRWGNTEKRRAFLEAYQDWELWITTPELKLLYYRYLLPDGTAIIAMEHQRNTFMGYDKGHEWQSAVRYYVQKPDAPFSPDSHISISGVEEMLKNAKVSLQKGCDVNGA